MGRTKASLLPWLHKLALKVISRTCVSKRCLFFIMDPRNEFNCIRVNMDDMASLEEVSELYFGEREDECNEEDDSPWNDSSSESDEDECYDDECEMYTDTSESDLSEKGKVRIFYENTCNCTLTKDDRPCSTTLSLDDFYDSRNNCHELSRFSFTWSNSKFA